jgi:hypothetical protein
MEKKALCFLKVVWESYGTEVWTQGLVLVRQVLCHSSRIRSPFCFKHFCNRVSTYALASLDHDPPIYASCVAGMTGAHNHVHLFIGWHGVSWTFYAWTGLQP